MADVLDTRLLQAQAEQMAPIDLLAALVTDELQRREDRLLARRHKQARFRDSDRSLDGFDFAFNKKINRALVFELATARFVAQREDALLIGPPGTGKSHLAQAKKPSTKKSRTHPIATGVSEGACRYWIRDRTELTGARGRLVEAEAALKLRALRASRDFDERAAPAALPTTPLTGQVALAAPLAEAPLGRRRRRAAPAEDEGHRPPTRSLHSGGARSMPASKPHPAAQGALPVVLHQFRHPFGTQVGGRPVPASVPRLPAETEATHTSGSLSPERRRHGAHVLIVSGRAVRNCASRPPTQR